MRIAILGLLALLVGGGTIYFAKEWLATERAASSAQTQGPQVPTTLVLVAAIEMAPSHFVKAEDLRWQEWPEDNLADAYVIQDEESPEAFVGTVVRSTIGEGDPITASRIVRPGDRGFLAAVLSPGMRAVSVPVNETSGIAGLIFPGDKVDVILTHSIRQDNGDGAQVRQVSETVLTNVRVLAIDQNVSADAQTEFVGDTATLEVTPPQAEKVSVMMQIGRLSLSLRSLAEGEADQPDNGQTFTMDTDVSSMIVTPTAEVQVAPPPEAVTRQITVFRGGQSTARVAMPEASEAPPAVSQSDAPMEMGDGGPNTTDVLPN